MSNQDMPSKPDLSLHTLSHFLDRFVYRNAKSSTKASDIVRGSSIMQPLAGGDSTGMVLSIRAAIRARAPVNTEEFWKKKIEDIPVDEVFFHRYFNQKGAALKSKSKNIKSQGEDDSASISDEDKIWDALVSSRPDLEPEDDVDMDDFDDDGEMLEDNEESDEDMAGLDNEDEYVSGSEAERGLTTDALADLNNFVSEEAVDDDDDDDSIPLDLEDLDSNSDALNSDDDIPSDIDQKLVELTKFKKTKSKNANGKIELAKDGDDRKTKRRKLKNLPIFASAEDFAELLGDDDDENM